MSTNTFRIAIRKFDPFETALQKIWTSFCAQSGCTLQLEAVPLDLHPLYDSLINDGGLKKGNWDVALINTDWIAEAAENGHVLPLTQPLKGEHRDFLASWSPALLASQTFGNEIYALPFHNGPECFIYRKDLFTNPHEQKAFQQQFNRTLSLPKTWDELKEVARFFHRPKQGLYGTVFAAYPDGHNTVFDYSLQVWTRGGDIVDAAGNMVLNTKEALDGMTFYRDMLKQGPVHPESRNYDSVGTCMAFARGELAMMVNWFGFASMSEVYEGSKVKGAIDIANLMAGEGEQGVSLLAYWMYVIGAGSQHADTAYQFIRHATSASNDKLLTLTGGIGCRKSTWTDEEVNQEIPYYHKLEELHAHTRALPRMSNWADVAHIIDEMVLKVINTDLAIQQILDQAQAKVQALQQTA